MGKPCKRERLRTLAVPCPRCLVRPGEYCESTLTGELLLSFHEVRLQLRRETERQVQLRLAREGRWTP